MRHWILFWTLCILGVTSLIGPVMADGGDPCPCVCTGVESTDFPSGRTHDWESRAIRAMRWLGAAQLAYQSANDQGEYGTWDAMVFTDNIPTGYTRANMIENYSLHVFYAQSPSYKANRSAFDGGFTIVAVPHSNKNRLRTFAICDDQVVRAATTYNLNIPAQAGNSWPTGDDVCQWGPLPLF